MPRTACASLCVLASAAAPSHAADDRVSSLLSNLADARWTQPERQTGVDAALSPPATPERYGKAGQEWLTLGAGAAHNFDDATDMNLFASWSRFLADDFEWMWEGGAWYFAQRDDNAFGANLTMVTRWHFVNRDAWTVFADAGVGLLTTTDNVPAAGTSLNFTPRVGIGMTARLDDGPARFVAGLRWHHVSNARIFGEDSNPSRDAGFIYFGISIPL
ncbi:MAG: acyloxyacyl hydrolase [Phycisphaerales bacterium JB037]